MKITKKTLSVVLGGTFLLAACNSGSSDLTQQAQINTVNGSSNKKTAPQKIALGTKIDLNDNTALTSYGNYVAQGLMDTVFGTATSFIPGSSIFINPIKQVLFDWLFGVDPDPYSERFDKIDSKLTEISDKLDLARAQMSGIDELVKKIYIDKTQETFNVILGNAQSEADDITNWDRNKYFKLDLYDKIRFISSGSKNSETTQKELNEQYSLLYKAAEKNCHNDSILADILQFKKPITKQLSASINHGGDLQLLQSSTPVDPANAYDAFINKYASVPGNSMTDYWRSLTQSKEKYLSSLFDQANNSSITHDNDYMLYVNILNQDLYDTTFKLFSAYQRLYDMQMIQLAHYYACNKNPIWGKKTQYSFNFSNLDVTKMPTPFAGEKGFTDSMQILNTRYDTSFKQLVQNIKDYLSPVQSSYVANKINAMYGKTIFGKSFTDFDSESVGYCSLIRVNDSKVSDEPNDVDAYANLDIYAACVKRKVLDKNNVGKYSYESAALHVSVPYIQNTKYGKPSDILVSNINYNSDLKLITTDMPLISPGNQRKFGKFINEKHSEYFTAGDTFLTIRNKQICPFGGCHEYKETLGKFSLKPTTIGQVNFNKLFGIKRTTDKENYNKEDIDTIIPLFDEFITTSDNNLTQANMLSSPAEFITAWTANAIYGSIDENGYFLITYNGKMLLGQLIYEYQASISPTRQLNSGGKWGGDTLKQRIKLSCIDPECVKDGSGKFSWKDKNGDNNSIELLLDRNVSGSHPEISYDYKLKGTH
ncbi:MAG: hypothetical protein K2Y14_08030 [Burkholderiales bacterium]|nr:hypothetical protein [Burkholderiales bacterium]